MTTWNNSNRYEMAQYILSSGMPLDEDECALINKALDDDIAMLSIYDLYDLNILCHMSNGFLRSKTGY